MGALAATQGSAFLFIGLFAGAWVDRLPRKPMMIIADLVRAILLGSIPLAAFWGILRIEHLYLVSFVAGLCSVFDDLAGTALTPQVVGRANLVEANSLSTTTKSGAGIAGPGLAGTLVQVVMPPLAIALDSLSFVVSGLLVGLIDAREDAGLRPRRRRRSIWHEIGEGLQVVARDDMLRALAGCGVALNIFGGIFAALYVLYVTQQLMISPFSLGVLGAVRSGGFVVGAVLATVIARRIGVRMTTVGGYFLIGGGWLLVPVVGVGTSITLPLLVIGHALSGFGNTLANVNASSLRQATTPDRLLGRVQATFRFLGRGVVPIGALLGGLLGETVGVRTTLLISVLGMLVGPCWLLLSPVAPLRTLPEAESEQVASNPLC
jgi:MFS family permease